MTPQDLRRRRKNERHTPHTRALISRVNGAFQSAISHKIYAIFDVMGIPDIFMFTPCGEISRTKEEKRKEKRGGKGRETSVTPVPKEDRSKKGKGKMVADSLAEGKHDRRE